MKRIKLEELKKIMEDDKTIQSAITVLICIIALIILAIVGVLS